MKKVFKGVTTLTFALSAFNVSANDAVLNIYNWAEYMPTDVIQVEILVDENKFGIKFIQ